MYCTVLDIELVVVKFIKQLGIFIDGKGQGYSFLPAKSYKRTKQAVWFTRTLQRIVQNSGHLDYSEFPHVLPRDIKGENFE